MQHSFSVQFSAHLNGNLTELKVGSTYLPAYFGGYLPTTWEQELWRWEIGREATEKVRNLGCLCAKFYKDKSWLEKVALTVSVRWR